MYPGFNFLGFLFSFPFSFFQRNFIGVSSGNSSKNSFWIFLPEFRISSGFPAADSSRKPFRRFHQDFFRRFVQVVLLGILLEIPFEDSSTGDYSRSSFWKFLLEFVLGNTIWGFLQKHLLRIPLESPSGDSTRIFFLEIRSRSPSGDSSGNLI